MIQIKYTFICDACGAKKEDDIIYVPEFGLPKPCIPYDWRKVGRYIFCPKHCVEVEAKIIVDGKPLKAYVNDDSIVGIDFEKTEDSHD